MLAVPRPFPPETRQPCDAAAGGWQAAIRPSRVWIGAATSKTLPDDERPANGHIDRLFGDEIMATFDTRGDQPDHAERAARAALDVQAETARLAAEHPHWPRFRVGVNTGEALVGVVGHHEGRRYTIVGDMVNTAARIEHAAPVGAVAIGIGTLTAIPAATTRSLGPLELRGKPEPVPVYVLEAL